jgi:hypothetical protein
MSSSLGIHTLAGRRYDCARLVDRKPRSFIFSCLGNISIFQKLPTLKRKEKSNSCFTVHMHFCCAHARYAKQRERKRRPIELSLPLLDMSSTMDILNTGRDILVFMTFED